MKRLLAGSLAVLALLALAGFLMMTLSPDRDPRHALIRRSSPVASVERTPVPELGERVERWRIVTAAGDTMTALWRGAAPGHDIPWTIVLLGGIGTNDRAALVVPAATPVNVLAMRWPWNGPLRMSALQFLAALPAIREACLRSPAVLAAGVAAVAREVGADRIAVLGVSLGAAPALAAMPLSEDARALMLIDGGADLGPLIRHELIRQHRLPAPVASLASRVAAWLLAPLEPSRNAAAVGSRRVLLVNALHDERMPTGAAERLHALLPGATVETRDAAHIGPDQTAAIADLALRSLRWLGASPAPSP